ncbi:glucose-1-phosphate adenylyltransferase, partial [Arthrobacter agilis]
AVAPSAARDRQYWRDVGTMDSYYEANMDLISPLPLFNLYNLQWPIYTRQSVSPPAKFVRSASGRSGEAHDSIVSAGVVVSGGAVQGSILATDVFIDEAAEVTGCVLLDKVTVGAGAVVRRAIIDKNVRIPPGAQIGVDFELDRSRGFAVTDSGLTIVSKGQVVAPAYPTT